MFNAELADFSGFSGDQKYYVSFIRQKAYIAVDEKGTEAAAATGLVLSITSITTSNRRPFICNKPFVYFIRNNNSGTILFGGIIRKPEYN